MDLRTEALTHDDQLLLETARRVITANYERGRHHVGAAVRMRDGRVFSGVHVEANVGRITLCAEAVALGAAITAGAREIDAVVAVAHPHEHEGPCEPWIVTPCGMCRELISDFGPEAWVIVPADDGDAVRVPISHLLPAKYARRRADVPAPRGPSEDGACGGASRPLPPHGTV